MKLSDYSIVEQLTNIPAQISLLSLLIHLDEHCKAIMKILNQAHVPNEVTANNENEALVYQAFEVMVVEHILERNLISKPHFPMASVMMVNEILKHGFELGKGLGIFLKGRAYSPIPPIYKSFIKARTTESSESSLPEPILEINEELINYFQIYLSRLIWLNSEKALVTEMYNSLVLMSK
ncbi:hypothetical protein H5410_015009 [Solanum commersonii]|uniref:Uncharacterized protein n=1 Tax=Solanum commersonii TaxID=4109 RepID=A0A9J5ZSJ8_SOLCO|nr:hypothetical protein H5410_015009 [Solanum commersonii]